MLVAVHTELRANVFLFVKPLNCQASAQIEVKAS